jgi:hypothetical protein
VKSEKEPPYNLENESKEVIRASWKNEMETHIDKTIQRITSRHFKKIRSGLNLLMNRVAALFRMINDTEEKDEEFIQETYTYGSFLLFKHIQEKIGGISKENIYRNIAKKKRSIKEEIEGKDVGKDLNEAKYKSDSMKKILVGLRANIAYLQEIRKSEVYDEIDGDQREARKERESNTGKRIEKLLTSVILA